ncbi:hypothetical protein [Segatella copri]|uniref:hypothetical protein n=1 Tax=Segatella copri TaxID=165179 RepID=UPI003F8A297A
MLKEKAKVMFGVADKDSFKTLIARTKDELQRDAYHRIPNLKGGGLVMIKFVLYDE